MFVQIIEGTTADPEALERRSEVWARDLRPGATGFLGATSGVTTDGRAITMARFESEAAARANSERPEQGQWWAETEKCYDGEVRFTESSDVSEWQGGGSDAAGFIQVMKMKGARREALESLDRTFDDAMSSLRPDVLGGIRVWTGPDACTEFVYFTSEAEARQGEKAEMPAEVQEAMSIMAEMEVEYLDLTAPVLT